MKSMIAAVAIFAVLSPFPVQAHNADADEKIESRFGPIGALFGDAAGAAVYATNNAYSNDNWSWTGFGTATAVGAITGAGAPPIAAVWGFNAAVAGASVAGVAGKHGY